MFRNLTFIAASIFPASAFAHSNGHTTMSLLGELEHMFSDPLHLALIAASVTSIGFAIKGIRIYAEKNKGMTRLER